MALTSYAQNFEDVMLWRALGHVKKGFYVDIGAQDPNTDSVSLLFYEHGWRGTNVEPTQHYADLLRSARPEDVVIQAAVDANNGILNFYEFPDTGLSTSDKEIAKKHIKSGFRVQELVVPSITLDDIFKGVAKRKVHWLKIDVEGSEKQVLAGWKKSSVRPWIVVIESTYPMTQVETHLQWESLILDKGYKFAYYDGLSRFYVAHGHEDLFKAFSAGPNVFDVMFHGFSLSATTPFCGNLHQQILSLKQQNKSEQQDAEQRFVKSSDELAEQLLAAKEHGSQQLSEQEQRYREQNEALKYNHTEIENALVAQSIQMQNELENSKRKFIEREVQVSAHLLASTQEAAQSFEQVRIKRENEHNDLTNQIRAQSEALMQKLAQRELEFTSQMLQIQQETAQQTTQAQIRHHQRELAIVGKHNAFELAISEKNSEIQAKYVSVMRELVNREQHYSTQIQLSQQQAADQLAAQELRYREQIAVLNSEQSGLKLALDEQVVQASEALKNVLLESVQQERQFSAQLLTINEQAALQVISKEKENCQRDAASQFKFDVYEQRHALELQGWKEKLHYAESAHNTEVNSQSHTIVQLRQLLAEVQQSFSWRMTVPFRACGAWLKGNGRAKAAPPHLEEAVSFPLSHSSKLPPIRLGQTNAQNLNPHSDCKAPDDFACHPNKELIMPNAENATDAQNLLGNSLLALPDHTFLEVVYQTFLGRPIDSSGRRNYLQNLLAGESREQIFKEIMNSPEAQARSAKLTLIRKLSALPDRFKPTPTAVPQSDFTASTIDELLELHGFAFVVEVYRILLGRAPEPKGLQNYLARLRAGDSKRTIIAQIANSSEAKLRKTLLPGLHKLVMAHNRSSHWLWGFIFRGGRAEREIHRMENTLGSMSSAITQLVIEANTRMADLALPIRLVLQTQEKAEDQLTSVVQVVAKLESQANAQHLNIGQSIQNIHALLDTRLDRLSQDLTTFVADAGKQIASLEKAIQKSHQQPGAALTPSPNCRDYDDAVKPTSIRPQRALCPNFSIIILQFHKSELTINCVRSLIRNTNLDDVEIIVVDNGSAREHLAKLRDEFGSLINIVDVGINRYYGEGNNIGVDHALGEFIVLMNNDIVVTSNWLPKLSEHLKTDNDVVGPTFLYPSGMVQECGAYIKEDGNSIQQYKGGFEGDLPKAPFECDYISAATILLKKQTFLKVGGFDLCYEPAYYEDVDLCLKIASYGGKIICVPEVKIFHNENATSSDASLGLKLTNDIVYINKMKFLDRWGAFISNRIGCPIEDQKIIGCAAAPLKMQAASSHPVKHKKAVLFSPYPLTPGGGEKYLLTIAQELSKNYQTTLAFEFSYSTLRLRQLESYLNLDLSDVSLMAFSQAKTMDWDVAFVLGNSMVPPFSKLSPISFYICQFPFDRASHFGKPMPFAADYQYICYSDFVKDHIRNGEFIQPDNITVLPPVIQTYAGSRRKEKIIISVGRFFTGGHCKNQHLLIEAFKQLVTDSFFKDWKLVLVGSTRPEHEHRQYYTQCVAASQGFNIEIIPDAPYNVLSALYAKASVYWHGSGLGVDAAAHPERLEHFGITPLEAASAGCYVFVPDAGGPREIARRAPGRFSVYSSIAGLIKATTKICSDASFGADRLDAQMHDFIASFNLANFGEGLTKTIDRSVNAGACDLTATVSPDDHRVRWLGWSEHENGFRWSNKHESKIEFYWGHNEYKNICINIQFHAYGYQKILVRLNGMKLIETMISGEIQVISVKACGLKPGFNSLVFCFPNAHQSGSSDSRLLALAFRSLSFSASSAL